MGSLTKRSSSSLARNFAICCAWLPALAAAAPAQNLDGAAAAEPPADASVPQPQGGAGTPLVIADIHPGAASSDAQELVRLGGVVYFRANDGTTGFELWRTDGTAAGTQQVIDLRPGPPNGFPANLTPIRRALYFNDFDTPEAEGSKVFRSDGTAAGTELLVDTFPGLIPGPFGPPLPDNFTPYRRLVLFTALDPEAGLELWRTDGTPAGTERVVDLHPGPESSTPVAITPFRGIAYFAADDSVIVTPEGFQVFDRELFRTDGTAAGTFRVKDINPGPEPSIPIELIPFRGEFYFVASEPAFGREIWKSAGTEEGTVRVTDVDPGPGSAFPQDLTQLRGRLVFSASDGSSGFEPWVTDGTEAGTRQVLDIHPDGDANPSSFVTVGWRAFFTADDGVHGNELWITDGTAAGTLLVQDIDAGPESSSPLELTPVRREVYFTTVRQTGLGDGSVLSELWRSDGTEAGTTLVWAAPGRSFGYAITEITLLGGRLLFIAPTEVDAEGISANYELYALDVRGSLPPL